MPREPHYWTITCWACGRIFRQQRVTKRRILCGAENCVVQRRHWLRARMAGDVRTIMPALVWCAGGADAC